MAAPKRRVNGEGTVYQLPNGRWRTVVTVGWETRPDGTRRRVTKQVQRSTQREVVEARRAILLEVNHAEPLAAAATVAQAVPIAEPAVELVAELPVDHPDSTGWWMTYFLEEIIGQQRAVKTYETYETLIRCWINPTIGSVPLAQLQPEHVEALHKAMRAGRSRTVFHKDGSVRIVPAKPLARSTVLQAHRILSRALKIAVRRKRIPYNVATMVDAPSLVERGSPRTGRAAKQFLDEDQARALLALIAGRWNAARWLTGLTVGCRQGELLGLQWDSDLDLDAGTLTVRNQLQRRRATIDKQTGEKIPGKLVLKMSPKSAAGDRTIVLPASLLVALRAHRQMQRENRLTMGPGWAQDPLGDLVFTQRNGSAIDPRQDWKEWSDMLVEISAPHLRQHAGRHTAASLMLLQGIDTKVVSTLLGHASTQITSDLYQHVMPVLHQDAADRMDDWMTARTHARANRPGGRA